MGFSSIGGGHGRMLLASGATIERLPKWYLTRTLFLANLSWWLKTCYTSVQTCL
jgi:hypothetical protein